MFAKRFILVVTWIYGPATKQTGKHTHTYRHRHETHTARHTQSHRVCVCVCVGLWFVCAFYLRLIRGQRPWKACYIFCHRSAGAKGYATKGDADDDADCIRQTCSALLITVAIFFSIFASVWPAPLCWILIKINYIKCSKQTASREQRTTDITDIKPTQSPAEQRDESSL